MPREGPRATGLSNPSRVSQRGRRRTPQPTRRHAHSPGHPRRVSCPGGPRRTPAFSRRVSLSHVFRGAVYTSRDDIRQAAAARVDCRAPSYVAVDSLAVAMSMTMWNWTAGSGADSYLARDPLEEMFNDSLHNCTNEYCVSDADYISMIEEHIFPRWYEWALIAMHCVVFVVGLVGNALVCVAVYRNHSMRTVTNYFIVNLAVADFMVILFCLPPSVVWDVTETWFMGTALCKVVLYFQTVSVAVSVLTLTFISVDRWYAICFPLQFRSTTGRAKVAIIVIWLLALSFDVPELVVLRTQRKEGLPVDTHLLTQCVPSWSGASDMTFHAIKTMALYTVPLLFMAVAYCQIARVLWRSDNIPGHAETTGRRPASNGLSSSRRGVLNATANATTEGQLRSRRKAAKMLVAVVVMFAVCFFPVHLLNILRYTMTIPQTDVTTAISSLSHWLCYANSAINPVIYNFMSGKFRKEFRRTFGFWWCRGDGRYSRRHTLTPHSSTYVCRFTATGDSTCTARTEMVPLGTMVACCPD